MAVAVRGGRGGGSALRNFFSYRTFLSAVFTLLFIVTLSALFPSHHDSVRFHSPLITLMFFKFDLICLCILFAMCSLTDCAFSLTSLKIRSFISISSSICYYYNLIWVLMSNLFNFFLINVSFSMDKACFYILTTSYVCWESIYLHLGKI